VNSALLFDSNNIAFAVDQGACLSLADSVDGTTCGMALDPLVQCEHASCNDPECQAAGDSAAAIRRCQKLADLGPCSSQSAAATAACAADLSGAGAGTTTCGTPLGVLGEICGNGM
jgi:hypothetical protein